MRSRGSPPSFRNTWYLPSIFSTTRSGMMYADRKSTRLNSSHSQISYAVFCLKKKKSTRNTNSEANTKHSHQDRVRGDHEAGATRAARTLPGVAPADSAREISYN